MLPLSQYMTEKTVMKEGKDGVRTSTSRFSQHVCDDSNGAGIIVRVLKRCAQGTLDAKAQFNRYVKVGKSGQLRGEDTLGLTKALRDAHLDAWGLMYEHLMDYDPANTRLSAGARCAGAPLTVTYNPLKGFNVNGQGYPTDGCTTTPGLPDEHLLNDTYNSVKPTLDEELEAEASMLQEEKEE